MCRIHYRLTLLFATACAAFAQTSGPVVGVGTFIHVVADLGRTTRFYGDKLGLAPTGAAGPRPFSSNTVIENLYNALGSQSRVAVFKITGSPLGLEFVEFKGVAQKPFQPGIGDAGASILTLAVSDVDAVLAGFRTDPAAIVTTDTSRHIAMLKDPDGFYVQLVAGGAGIPAARLSLVSATGGATQRVFHDLLGFSFSGMAAKVPGTDLDLQLMEFRHLQSAPEPPSIHDPGAGVLRLQVRNVDTLLQTLKNAKVPVASVGGNVVNIGDRHFVILRDPDGFYFQLAPQTQAAPAPPK